jgi:Domain of unknown function (DUF4258)
LAIAETPPSEEDGFLSAMRQAFTRAGLHHTSHAAEQMDRRRINPDDVEAALEACDTTFPGSDLRRENLVKVGPVDDRRLFVVVKRERPFIVVSAYWGDES